MSVIVWGTDRNDPDGLKAHAYHGPSYNELVAPMCGYGWNRSGGHAFSIFRNNTSTRGKCAICHRRIEAGLEPIREPWPHKTRWI